RRVGHIGDVQDEPAAVPVADVETVPHADGMVAARLFRPTLAPAALLSAGGPLAGHPPASNLLRVGRVGEIEDDDDVSGVALHARRQVGVPAVERESVDAVAGALPEKDLARLGGIRD